MKPEVVGSESLNIWKRILQVNTPRYIIVGFSSFGINCNQREKLLEGL